jgi:glycosyltransferase involved in cell wall biosynthesis
MTFVDASNHAATRVPLISVIMPVYNADRFLQEAVDSILNQTLDDFELIVINDGSTDGSLSLLQDYAAKDPRVRLFSRENKGLVATLNEGISAARGEFIARMDADDRCEPTRFALQIDRLRQEPALVALGSWAVAIDQDGMRIGPAPVPLEHEEIERALLAGRSCIYHPAVMMRAPALRQIGGYRDMAPAEDFDLWLRLSEVGRLANLREPLFIWRRVFSGIVAQTLSRQVQAVHRALRDAWIRRGLTGDPPAPFRRVQNIYDIYRQIGWTALRCSEPKTARKYAAKALRSRPWLLDSWKLAVCAMRGR